MSGIVRVLLFPLILIRTPVKSDPRALSPNWLKENRLSLWHLPGSAGFVLIYHEPFAQYEKASTGNELTACATVERIIRLMCYTLR